MIKTVLARPEGRAMLLPPADSFHSDDGYCDQIESRWDVNTSSFSGTTCTLAETGEWYERQRAKSVLILQKILAAAEDFCTGITRFRPRSHGALPHGETIFRCAGAGADNVSDGMAMKQAMQGLVSSGFRADAMHNPCRLWITPTRGRIGRRSPRGGTGKRKSGAHRGPDSVQSDRKAHVRCAFVPARVLLS